MALNLLVLFEVQCICFYNIDNSVVCFSMFMKNVKSKTPIFTIRYIIRYSLSMIKN